MVPWIAGRAEEHAMDDVQPGKIANRIGHLSGSHVRVAPVTGGISAGVGRSLGDQDDPVDHPRGVREVDTATWPKLQHLQVPLSAERKGFIRPAIKRATVIEDVLIRILGNAVLGGPRAQARILGQRAHLLAGA
jgi:hypothetical protein